MAAERIELNLASTPGKEQRPYEPRMHTDKHGYKALMDNAQLSR